MFGNQMLSAIKFARPKSTINVVIDYETQTNLKSGSTNKSF